MKSPVLVKNFSKGIVGPRGQFRQDVESVVQNATNFIVERDGSLRNRPATTPIGIPLLKHDKFVVFDFKGETYTLVYDPLIFCKFRNVEPPHKDLVTDGVISASATTDQKNDIRDYVKQVYQRTDFGAPEGIVRKNWPDDVTFYGHNNEDKPRNPWYPEEYLFTSPANGGQEGLDGFFRLNHAGDKQFGTVYNRYVRYRVQTIEDYTWAHGSTPPTSTTQGAVYQNDSVNGPRRMIYDGRLGLTRILYHSFYHFRMLLYRGTEVISDQCRLSMPVTYDLFGEDNCPEGRVPTPSDFDINDEGTSVWREKFTTPIDMEYRATVGTDTVMFFDSSGRLPPLVCDPKLGMVNDFRTIWNPQIMSFLIPSVYDPRAYKVGPGTINEQLYLSDFAGGDAKTGVGKFKDAVPEGSFSTDAHFRVDYAPRYFKALLPVMEADRTAERFTLGIANKDEAWFDNRTDPPTFERSTGYYNRISLENTNDIASIDSASGEIPIRFVQNGSANLSKDILKIFGNMGVTPVVNGDRPILYPFRWADYVGTAGRDFAQPEPVREIVRPFRRGFTQTYSYPDQWDSVSATQRFGFWLSYINPSFGLMLIRYSKISATLDISKFHRYLPILFTPASLEYDSEGKPLFATSSTIITKLGSSPDLSAGTVSDTAYVVANFGGIKTEIDRGSDAYTNFDSLYWDDFPAYNSGTFFNSLLFLQSRLLMTSRDQFDASLYSTVAGITTSFVPFRMDFSIYKVKVVNSTENPLANDGYRHTFSTEGGVAIFNIALLGGRLQISTTRGPITISGSIDAESLPSSTNVTFGKEELPSTNLPIELLSTFYQLSEGGRNLFLRQESNELQRNRYIDVGSAIGDFTGEGIISVFPIQNSGRLIALTLQGVFHGLVNDDGTVVWTQLDFGVRDSSIFISNDLLYLKGKGGLEVLNFNDLTPIEEDVELSLQLISPPAYFWNAEGQLRPELGAGVMNYSNGGLVGDFDQRVLVGSNENENQFSSNDREMVPFGPVSLADDRDGLKFTFLGRNIKVDSVRFEVGT